LRVKERKYPKLYWVAAGVLRAVKGEFHPPGGLECGALLEDDLVNAAMSRGFHETARERGQEHEQERGQERGHSCPPWRLNLNTLSPECRPV
jgi:hypothetical protein